MVVSPYRLVPCDDAQIRTPGPYERELVVAGGVEDADKGMKSRGDGHHNPQRGESGGRRGMAPHDAKREVASTRQRTLPGLAPQGALVGRDGSPSAFGPSGPEERKAGAEALALLSRSTEVIPGLAGTVIRRKRQPALAHIVAPPGRPDRAEMLPRISRELRTPARGLVTTYVGLALSKQGMGDFGRWVFARWNHRAQRWALATSCAGHNGRICGAGVIANADFFLFKCAVIHGDTRHARDCRLILGAESDASIRSYDVYLRSQPRWVVPPRNFGVDGVRGQALNGANGEWTGTDDMEPDVPTSVFAPYAPVAGLGGGPEGAGASTGPPTLPRLPTASSEETHPPPSQPAKADFGALLERLRKEAPSERKKREGRGKPGPEGNCHICGKAGHYARACPKAAEHNRRSASGKPRKNRTEKRKAAVALDQAEAAVTDAANADAQTELIRQTLEAAEDKIAAVAEQNEQLKGELKAFHALLDAVKLALDSVDPDSLTVHLRLNPIEGRSTKADLVAYADVCEKTGNKSGLELIQRELQKVPATLGHATAEAMEHHLPSAYKELLPDVHMFIPIWQRIMHYRAALAAVIGGMSFVNATAITLLALDTPHVGGVWLVISVVNAVGVLLLAIFLAAVLWPRKVPARVVHTFLYVLPPQNVRELLSIDRRNMANQSVRALGRIRPYEVRHSTRVEVLYQNTPFWHSWPVFRAVRSALCGFYARDETWIDIADLQLKFSLDGHVVLTPGEDGVIPYLDIYRDAPSIVPYLNGMVADETLLRYLSTTARNMLPGQFSFDLATKHVAQMLCTNGAVANNLFSSHTNSLFHTAYVLALVGHLKLVSDTRQVTLGPQDWAF